MQRTEFARAEAARIERERAEAAKALAVRPQSPPETTLAELIGAAFAIGAGALEIHQNMARRNAEPRMEAPEQKPPVEDFFTTRRKWEEEEDEKAFENVEQDEEQSAWPSIALPGAVEPMTNSWRRWREQCTAPGPRAPLSSEPMIDRIKLEREQARIKTGAPSSRVAELLARSKTRTIPNGEAQPPASGQR